MRTVAGDEGTRPTASGRASRRGGLVAAIIAAVALVPAACGGDDPSSAGGRAAVASPGADATSSPDPPSDPSSGADGASRPDGSYAAWRLTDRGAVVEIDADAYQLTLDATAGLVLHVGPPGRRRPVGAYVVHDGDRVPVAEADRPVIGVDHLRVDVRFAEPGRTPVGGAVEVAADGPGAVALRLSLDDPAGVTAWGWEVDPPVHSFEVEVPEGALVVDHRVRLAGDPDPGRPRGPARSRRGRGPHSGNVTPRSAATRATSSGKMFRSRNRSRDML